MRSAGESEMAVIAMERKSAVRFMRVNELAESVDHFCSNFTLSMK
jgi:hypothetical protein